MRKEDIVGVYRQTGEEAVSADGTVTAGEAKNSQIMYSADGYMSVLSGPAVRKPFAERESRVDLNGASPEQRAEVSKDIVCYAGRYELTDDAVIHHVEMALNPNLIGQAVVRRTHLAGRDLTLSSVPDANGNYRRILWRRV
jgi:hypothetical protein